MAQHMKQDCLDRAAEHLDRLQALAAAPQHGGRSPLHGQNYLLTSRLSRDQLLAVYHAASAIELIHEAGARARLFHGGLAVSVFRDKSTRTRCAFQSACALLGLAVQDFDESKSQVAHGETDVETASMLSFATEAVGIRDDLFLGHGHEYMRRFAAGVRESFEAGVLPQLPAVVNLQCDVDHPTQSMADLMHLARRFGGLGGLAGKRVAVTWAHSPAYGKPLSVPQALITLLPRFGVRVVLAHPPGYGLLPETLEAARRGAEEGGGSFETAATMDEAFAGAHAVYPKSWAPRSVMERRCELLRAGEAAAGLDALEAECAAANAAHAGAWECTRERMALARPGALYMHCLPADISGLNCDRGEVSADVFAEHRLDTYREARHKPFVVAAAIALARLPDAPALLARLAREPRPLRGP